LQALLGRSMLSTHFLHHPAGEEPVVRVLLVEDNLSDARLACDILDESSSAERFEVTHVDRLQEALRLLYEEVFEAVLLDLSLPDSHGLESVTEVRCSVPWVPVVVLSGIDDETLAVKAVEAGAQDFLVKGREEPSHVVRAIRYAVSRQRSARRLTYLAQYDYLTGLANPTLFRDRLEQALARAARSERPLALLFVDLDRFKDVNDEAGHDVGDALLQEVASRLRNCVRQSDTVARIGGDEFTVVLEGLEHTRAAANVAQKILDALAGPFRIMGRALDGGASIGIALSPHCGRDAASLIRSADQAMYRAKSDGGGRYCFYTEEMDAEARLRLERERALQRAVERNEFRLYYQPQVDLATGELRAMEALLRWQCPESSDPLPPAEFITLAEETGLIVPIGEWVLHTACAQARAWATAGLPPCRVSVNLSPRQFAHRSLLGAVEEAVREAQLDPALLELELTENALMRNVDASSAILSELKGRGLGISVDDFGTGCCSLSSLRQFPLDTLKIDRSFIARTAGPIEGAFASTIVDLAHRLSLRVVAEGVETEDDLLRVRHLATDEVQGYFFGVPRAAVGFP